MNLIYTVEQYKNGLGPNVLESALSIEVDYDPEERVVREIIKVWTYSYRFRTVTDITAIMAETFSKQLDQIILHADWWQIFCDAKEENRQKVA